MTPGARLQSAIEILDEIFRSGRPADRVFDTWSRSSRFAGSKDRTAVSEIVFTVLRRRAELGAACGSDEARLLAFAALLMAGLDGIKNKIHPGQPMDKDLYDLPPKELKQIPTVSGSLREALVNLDKDRAFLKAGGVFDDDQIDAFIELKMAEVMRFEMTPHPVEFDMYYSV